MWDHRGSFQIHGINSCSISANIVWPNTEQYFQFVHYWNQLLELIFLAKKEVHSFATFTAAIYPFLLDGNLAKILL